MQQRSGGARWEQLRSRALSSPERERVDTEPAPDAPEESAPAAPEDIAPAAPEPNWAGVESGPTEIEAAPPRPFDVRTFESLQEFRPERQTNFGQTSRSPRLTPARETVLLQTDEPAGIGSTDDFAAVPVRPNGFNLRPITDIQPFFDYSPTGEDPCEHLCPAPGGVCPDDPDRLCPVPLEMPLSGSPERFFPHLEYYWAAADLHHNPLYFENPALERYGHVHFNDCIEPAYSMARFSAQLVGLPYQMALDAPWRDQYALGWHRPGDFSPKLAYQPPLNARAAGVAAAVYTGLFLLVP